MKLTVYPNNWSGDTGGVDCATATATIESSALRVQKSRLALPLWQSVVLTLIIAFLYRSILWKLAGQWWTDPNFSHGFLVPVFSGFVVWQRRHNLRRLAAKPSWLGLPIIVAALLTLIVGVLGAELFISRSSLILLLAGLIIYFAGWRFFQALLFPWLCLFLMIPIPTIVFNEIAFPLQFFASRLATDILRVVGVPVLREGNIIVLPSMPLEVAEACSGIRSLMSLTTIAIIYGHFMEATLWRRLILTLIALPVAVAANAFRIVGTGLAVQYWDPAKGQGFFHEFSGWFVFVISLALIFGLDAILRRFVTARGRLA